MNFYTDDAIIDGLKKRDNGIIRYIYKEYYPTIKFLITTNSGTDTDAEDVFQDALVVLYRKIAKENLLLTSSFKTFLYSICRNLWLQRLDRRVFSSEFMEVEDLGEMQESLHPEHPEEEQEKYRLFQQHFLQLSPDCQKVLKLFMGKTSLKEIADIMGFKTEKYAKTRKFMCKEKLKEMIINDPYFKKYLSDYE
ncbi:MAG TPA: sigma-70 family RNA polymerase sigma factor [Bacteroidales bacterium]|jgi:RNA polymerase sigma factor (sigma-70 family)|nr:sigma-70 family RNA polymerase sigma factor [Bacteroidales bacterium]HOX76675.1 sigma-70 family RNA polymerase sigma factor [Bacteroidales bacterium]